MIDLKRDDAQILRLLGVIESFEGTALDPVAQITKPVRSLYLEGLEQGDERFDRAIHDAHDRLTDIPAADIEFALDTLDELILILNEQVRRLLLTDLTSKSPFRALMYMVRSAARIDPAQEE